MKSKETSVQIDQSNQVDEHLEFISNVRSYNKEGPHIYDHSNAIESKSKLTRRLIRKNGKYNVVRKTESHIRDKYLRDFSNTLIHSRWRWTIISASSSFVLSWLLFALIWMLISNANGDLEAQKPPDAPCLSGISSFAGYFLFSLETQATIGYGSRYINHHCPEGVFIICLQIILGVAICGLMVNIVYIKMIRPLNKYQTQLFSKKAIICRRDGELSLIFRVRDEDSKHAIGTSITAYILRREKDLGEPCLQSLPLEPYGILIWPLEVVHKITSSSPLWDISSIDLILDEFELIVTLQGTSLATGQCTKSRTSYLSSEIVWGHRFKPCVKYNKKENSYIVNHKNFNVTEEHLIHLCSAKRFAEVYESINQTPASSPVSNFKLEIRFSPETGGLCDNKGNSVPYVPKQEKIKTNCLTKTQNIDEENKEHYDTLSDEKYVTNEKCTSDNVHLVNKSDINRSSNIFNGGSPIHFIDSNRSSVTDSTIYFPREKSKQFSENIKEENNPELDLKLMLFDLEEYLERNLKFEKSVGLFPKKD